MTTLIFQTDTSGKFHHHLGIDERHQPHMVRLAWMTLDDDGEELSSPCTLIRPRPDWKFEDDAVVANLVTREAAMQYGESLERVMARFTTALASAKTVVAFNYDFHRKVIQRSAYECGLNWEDLFADKHTVCAMREATDIVRVPRMAPGGGWLWPKLTVAYTFFTGEEIPTDLDPILRGVTLVHAVRDIYQGILETQRTTPHE